jgi:hypothetical protein
MDHIKGPHQGTASRGSIKDNTKGTIRRDNSKRTTSSDHTNESHQGTLGKIKECWKKIKGCWKKIKGIVEKYNGRWKDQNATASRDCRLR